MSQHHIIDDLFAYNSWANGKILALCEDLSSSQLDQQREMGFGSLRATLFHILAAEQVWMNRFAGAPWRPLPTDPESITIEELAEGLRAVAAQRRSLIEIHRELEWTETIKYQDTKKVEHKHCLLDLLVHVVNHGVHHRAQALNFLRHFGQTVPVGLDYIFFRLAATTVKQEEASVRALTESGLEVGTLDYGDPEYDPDLVQRLYADNDWATAEIFEMCEHVEVASLDRDFKMGCGSIRKTLLHLIDAEQWWIGNWNGEAGSFPRSPETMKLQEIETKWRRIRKQRNTFLESVDADRAMDVVVVHPPGPPCKFRVGESAVHVAFHGTHHRAQLLNMIRRSKAKVHNIDFLYAIDQLPKV